ncbi:PREDICTED: HIG1 domain family member 2A, mitochondrial [Polistes dominula]|uniref:HIG1 domain family member 2A, mitochondrial n=1 Tax=Polistes dominula TaxID=743375 RepID=A0ABM1JGW4_POLDO|nr:PREDICTED: HIG1 domain family member 2A, mitochondrial [Polistes dominula]
MEKNLSKDAANKDLDWVTIKDVSIKEFPIGSIPESTKDKFFRKMKENPFVPIGSLATVSALVYGLYNFVQGNSQMSQYMMRTRVAAQAFTFIAITTGFILAQKKLNAKNTDNKVT